MKNKERKLSILLALLMVVSMLTMVSSSFANESSVFAYNSAAKQVASGVVCAGVLGTDGRVYMNADDGYGTRANGHWRFDAIGVHNGWQNPDKFLGWRTFNVAEKAPGVPLENIVQLYIAARQVLALDKNNHIWAWGPNDSYMIDFTKPAFTDAKHQGKCSDPMVEYAMDVTAMWAKVGLKINPKNFQVAAGGLSHILVIDEKNQLWSWGRGRLDDVTVTHTDFRLGYDPGDANIHSKKPTKIKYFMNKKIVKVGAMTMNSYALDDKGNAYVWGRGGGDRIWPVTVSDAGAKPFKDMQVGAGTAILLGSNGKLYKVENGIKLPNEKGILQETPKSGNFLDPKLDFYTKWGSKLPIAVLDPLGYKNNVLKGKKIVKYKVGGNPDQADTREGYYVFALANDGVWYVWGRTRFGSTTIDNGKTVSPVVATKVIDKNFLQLQDFSSYHDASIGIGKDGKVYTWGSDLRGELGRALVADEMDPELWENYTYAEGIGDARVLPVSLVAKGPNYDVVQGSGLINIAGKMGWEVKPGTPLKAPATAAPTPTPVATATLGPDESPVATDTPAPTATDDSQATPEATAEATTKPITDAGSSSLLPIIIAVVVLGGGFAAYWFLIKKKQG